MQKSLSRLRLSFDILIEGNATGWLSRQEGSDVTGNQTVSLAKHTNDYSIGIPDSSIHDLRHRFKSHLYRQFYIYIRNFPGHWWSSYLSLSRQPLSFCCISRCETSGLLLSSHCHSICKADTLDFAANYNTDGHPEVMVCLLEHICC